MAGKDLSATIRACFNRDETPNEIRADFDAASIKDSFESFKLLAIEEIVNLQ